MSLISVMIAAGIGTMVVYSVSKAMTTQMKAQKSVEIRSEKSTIKRYIENVTSCSASLGSNPVATCSGGYIDLYKVVKGKKKKVVSSSGTTMGMHTVVAECNEDSDGIIIRAARMVENGDVNSSNPKDFLADPLTRKNYTFKDDKTLLSPIGTELCSDTQIAPVEVITGTYNGECNAYSFIFCKSTKKITLPGQPVSIQIFSAPESKGISIFPFSAVKSDSMKGAGGWQSVTSVSGVSLISGSIFDAYNAAVKIESDGFVVRKAMNVNYKGLFNARYHFIAHIRK